MGTSKSVFMAHGIDMQGQPMRKATAMVVSVRALLFLQCAQAINTPRDHAAGARDRAGWRDHAEPDGGSNTIRLGSASCSLAGAGRHDGGEPCQAGEPEHLVKLLER